jgi:glycerol-3-phosphate O-acyltransferase
MDIDVEAMLPVTSPIVLRPFLEAYYIVAETLVVLGSADTTPDELSPLCLRMGNQTLAHGAVETSEAVSTTLFASGIKAAASRGLLAGDAASRHAYADELKGILHVLNRIDADIDAVVAEAIQA